MKHPYDISQFLVLIGSTAEKILPFISSLYGKGLFAGKVKKR